MTARFHAAPLLVAFALAMPAQLFAATGTDEPDAYDKIRARGALEAVVYNRYPPYSFERNGKMVGIDVDLAGALAQALGLGVKVRVAEAGEDMDEDLRNYLWKGSVLGGGVSDLMMHVGADPEYVRRQHQVAIFSPYYHESIALALRTSRIKNYVSLEQLKGKKVAVELGSISDLYLSGAYGGLLRESLRRFPSTTEAVRSFTQDQSDAVILGRGELQGLLKELGGTTVEPKQVEFRGMFRSQWDVGLAVKSDNLRLREALDAVMKKLADSGELAAIFARYGVDYVPAAAPQAAEPAAAGLP